MSGVAGVFLIATALFGVGGGLIAVFAPRGASGEYWRHYAATVLIAAAILVPAALHPALFAALAALLAWRCALELADLQRLPVTRAASLAVGLAALGAVALAGMPALLMALTAGVAVIAAPGYAGATRVRLDGPRRWLFALALPLAGAAQMSWLARGEHGFLWICFLYGVVEAQDSMAFLFGKLFGRRPLAPRLSPRKTQEGALAGVIAGLVVGALVGVLLIGRAWPIALALAALVAAAGFGGDLFASGLKRGAGVKDFKPVHPRHGGLLDIYDSTLCAALVLGPALWLLGMP